MLSISRILALKNTFYLIFSLALYSVCQWLILAYISRKWGVGLAGEYSYSLAILTPVFLLAYQSYRTVIVTDSYPEGTIESYLRLRLIVTFICFLGSITYLFLTTAFSEKFIFIFIFLIKAIEGVVDLVYAFLQKNKDMKIQAGLLVSRCILGIIAFVLGSLFFKDYKGSFVILLIFWLLFIALVELKSFPINFKSVFKGSLQNDTVDFINILKITYPLVLSSLVGAVLYNIPRYSLVYNYNTEILGYFSILTSFSIGVNLLCASLGQASLPWLVASKASVKKFFTISFILISIVLISSFVLSVTTYFFGNIILSLIFRINYDNEIFFIIMLLLIPLYVGQILSFISNSLILFKTSLYVNLSGLFVVGILAVPLVKKYEMLGAGYLMAIMGIIQIIGYGYSILNYFYKRKLS